MVDYNLISDLDVDESKIDAAIAEAFGGSNAEQISEAIADTVGPLQSNQILRGKVINVTGNEAVIDVGLKGEGILPLNEWDDPSGVDVGDEVDVWLEAVQADTGMVIISKRKADRVLNWERLTREKKEGDLVRGRVMRKIKGGLLVDIGVPVFLPASQVDIRRPGDISEFIGHEIEAKILKIDLDRRNIVISRRKKIEEDRATAKAKLMAEIEVGQIRRGVVKNIADFGAFVDLGGIDGLLHITDMSWERISHPSEMLKIDDEVEIKILNIDREKEKIALGLKHLSEDPWARVEEKYPIGKRVKGSVVNIMNYGAFVKLEGGIEGLLHISEMSWTRRINHPSEMLNANDEIDVVVLEVNKDKQEISLGLKQTEVNPWTRLAEKYPPNTVIEGRVRNLTNYGAFIEIEEGIDGLLHVTDMSWTKKIGHPSEMLRKGDMVKCVVLSVDQEKMRVALGFKQLHEDPWLRAVPERYIPGQIVRGKVTKITNFGVFVELEPDLEGLLHVSELADHKVDDPHDEVKIGEEVEVKILRVDPTERKIGLSKKRAEWAAAEEDQTAPRKVKPRRGGLHGPGEETTSLLQETAFLRPPPETREPSQPSAEDQPEASQPEEAGPEGSESTE
jgi:small subunit ribosomal protein S1